MSNTLEETLDRRLHAIACSVLGLDDEDHEDDEQAKLLEDSLKSLILSEAHRIGMEAIGEDGPEGPSLGGDTGGFWNRGRNVLREEQRQRLSKLTGVKD